MTLSTFIILCIHCRHPTLELFSSHKNVFAEHRPHALFSPQSLAPFFFCLWSQHLWCLWFTGPHGTGALVTGLFYKHSSVLQSFVHLRLCDVPSDALLHIVSFYPENISSFPVWSIIHNAAVCRAVLMSVGVPTSISFGYIVGFLDCMVILGLNFELFPFRLLTADAQFAFLLLIWMGPSFLRNLANANFQVSL